MVLPYTTDDLINARKLIDAGPRGEALILGTYTLRGVQIQYQVIAVHRQRVADGSPRRRSDSFIPPNTAPAKAHGQLRRA